MRARKWWRGDAHREAKIEKDGSANGAGVEDILGVIIFIAQNLRIVHEIEKFIITRLPVPDDGYHLLSLARLGVHINFDRPNTMVQRGRRHQLQRRLVFED